MRFPLTSSSCVFDLGLRAYDMSKKQLLWLHDHLDILCGLYGVVRPLDEIKAYRLEMGTKLKNARGKDLYEFWGDKILTSILKGLREGDAIVNCASQEYAKSARLAEVPPGIRVYTMAFPGPTVYAKVARGSIVRYACDHQVTDVEDLKRFTGQKGEYAFCASASTDTTFTFARQAGVKPKTEPKRKVASKRKRA